MLEIISVKINLLIFSIILNPPNIGKNLSIRQSIRIGLNEINKL